MQCSVGRWPDENRYATQDARTVIDAAPLLDSGADPDAQRDDGVTALMLAASDDSRENVIALLDRGADPSLRDSDDNMASDYAGPRTAELLSL